MGPGLPFNQKDEFYSGKHKRHCLKKEVIVNVRSGTAAMISQEHPGSVPDVEILKRHAENVNRMIGPTRVLADKGYRGVTQVPNLHVVTDENGAEKRARVIVEQFFGRLKSSCAVFARPWELSWRRFSDLFDIGCALTNILLDIHPLNIDDWDFKDGIFRKWKNKWKSERNATKRGTRGKDSKTPRARNGFLFDSSELLTIK